MGSQPDRRLPAVRAPPGRRAASLTGATPARAGPGVAGVLGLDQRYLPHTNPEPGVFSPIQFAAHVRDILRAYGDRVILVMAEDEPTVPQLNPNSEEWDAYNRLDAEELADDLEAQAARLAELLAALDDEDWRQTFIRDSGQDGVVRYNLAGLASYAVHEAHRHLKNADGTLPVGGGSPDH